MLKGGTMKDLYEMRGLGYSIRGITRELGVSRNSVRKYLRSPGVPQAKQRPRRGSKLDAYAGYIDRRLGEGLDNCVVLHRELRSLGYEGGYTILVEYVRLRRPRRELRATMRFETEPGEHEHSSGTEPGAPDEPGLVGAGVRRFQGGAGLREAAAPEAGEG